MASTNPIRALLRPALAAAAALGVLCGAPAALRAADPQVTVTSLNPDSGVWLTPCCGMAACAQFVQETPFTYSCPAGTPVRLEAPAVVGETPFSEWRSPGHLPYTLSPTFSYLPDMDVTLTVVYGNPVEPLPDLVVGSIVLTPASPIAGATFSAQVHVQNQGAAATGIDFASVDLWLDREATPGCATSGDTARALGNLSPASGRIFTINGLTAGPAGSATFRAFADSWCLVEEEDETNNQRTLAYTVRPRKILSVASENPASASIAVSPADLFGAAGATAPFSRSYDPGATVTLTAPADVGGYVFQRWRQDGAELATTREVAVTMDADHILTAVYVRPPSPDFTITNITILPAEPTAGYVFSASVTVRNAGDVDGFGGKLAVWTNLLHNLSSCNWHESSQWLQVGALAAGESKTLIFTGLGPLSQGSYHFRAYVDAACDTLEGVNGDRESGNQWTRDYLVIPGTVHTLSVGTLDGRAAPIAHTMDVSGRNSGTTSFTRHFRDRTTVTLTAPATTPDGGVFQKWIGLEPVVATTPEVTFTMDYGKGLTAVYVGPGEPDFAVTALTVDPPSPPAGGTFSATVTITNVGTGRGVPGLLRIFPSRDAPAGCWGWTPYGPMYIHDLAAGASATFTVPDIPAGERGARQVLAYVDSTCDTGEPDEANNQLFAPYEAVQEPPVLGAIGDRAVAEGATLTFAVAATDANNDPLVYEATGLPIGAGFDPATRVFSWTPGFDAAGSYPGARFAVGDGDASDEETITITVLPTNRPPTLDPVGDRSITEGEELAFTVTASDPDGDTPLTLEAANLPAWAALEPATGLLHGTPGFDQGGRHEGIVFTVTDPSGAAATETIAIDVAEPAGPVFEDHFTDAAVAGADDVSADAEDWLPLAGAWSRANGVYAATSGKLSALTRVALLDPGALPLGAGAIEVRAKLTGTTTSPLGPNALIVFGFTDPGHYRWVRLRGASVQIGQAGEIDGIPGGKKRGATTTLRTGSWYRLTVRIEPDGWVRVLKGASPAKLLVQHRFLAPGGVPSVVPGGVGLATSKAKAVFDDVVVWEDSALAP